MHAGSDCAPLASYDAAFALICVTLAITEIGREMRERKSGLMPIRSLLLFSLCSLLSSIGTCQKEESGGVAAADQLSIL